MSCVDTILPSAGRISGSFATEAGAEIKALISLGGRTLLERALDAVRGIGRSVVIGPEALQEARTAATAVLPEVGSGPANILQGLGWLQQHPPEAERILVLTTDLPFITAEAVQGFLRACPPDADVCVPVFRREEFEERYPGAPNVYVRLREGAWTTGSAFLLNTQVLTANRAHIENLFAARKSQLAMARLLGALFILRFVARRLAIEHVERRCRDILGCSGAAVLGCDPALAYDIDLPEEYRYARERLHA